VLESQEEERQITGALERLDHIETHMTKMNVGSAFRHLSDTTKSYLKWRLKIYYECTYQDLQAEVKKSTIGAALQVKISTLLRRMADMEYGSYKLSVHELHSLAEEVRAIIVGASSKKAPSERAKQSQVRPDDMIHKAVQALHNHQLQSAANLYREIMKMYDRMSNDEKKRCFLQVRKLYEDIVRARGKA
jgi:hypothetical protein